MQYYPCLSTNSMVVTHLLYATQMYLRVSNICTQVPIISRSACNLRECSEDVNPWHTEAWCIQSSCLNTHITSIWDP